jgi:hypothetical protein
MRLCRPISGKDLPYRAGSPDFSRPAAKPEAFHTSGGEAAREFAATPLCAHRVFVVYFPKFNQEKMEQAK